MLHGSLLSRIQNSRTQTQGTLISLTICLYFLPLVLLMTYAIQAMTRTDSWSFFSMGLLLTFLGSYLLFYLLQKWHNHYRYCAEIMVRYKLRQYQKAISKYLQAKQDCQITESDCVNDIVVSEETTVSYEESPWKQEFEDAQQRVVLLSGRLNKSEQKIQKLESDNEEKASELAQAKEEISKYVSSADQKDDLLSEYQKTIAEQRKVIENKQEELMRLENKVRDLNYEIKTLLQLGDMYPSSAPVPSNGEKPAHPVLDLFNDEDPLETELENYYSGLASSSTTKIETLYDAAQFLRKCIDTASKHTGASHLSNNNSRLLDLSIESYAIDLRRLFDSFRNESSCIIALYSRTEDRLLFVNNQIKGIVGWAPEKFVSDYPNLIQKGFGEWKQNIHQVGDGEERHTRLLIKTADNKDTLLHCCLGVISQGVFANHVVSVLYPATSDQ